VRSTSGRLLYGDALEPKSRTGPSGKVALGCTARGRRFTPTLNPGTNTVRPPDDSQGEKSCPLSCRRGSLTCEPPLELRSFVCADRPRLGADHAVCVNRAIADEKSGYRAAGIPALKTYVLACRAYRHKRIRFKHRRVHVRPTRRSRNTGERKYSRGHLRRTLQQASEGYRRAD
jgi:hypothetical protein